LKNPLIRKQKNRGGAALEYVVISLFGITLTLGGISIVSNIYKEKLDKLSEKFGLEISSDFLDVTDFARD
jgi:hypothetical protein